jgi:hypothetical protein
MKNQTVGLFEHPNPLDRNRSILLSRDLLQMKDWVALAIKRSSIKDARVIPGDARELISVGVMAANQRILLDVLVRPDGAVNSDLLKLHGCDPAHAFNAPTFPEVYKILKAGFSRSRVLCYKVEAVQEELNQLCRQEKLPALHAEFIDVQQEYSRFVGQSSLKSGYKLQSLPDENDCSSPGISTLSECAAVISAVQEMAASSQTINSATAFDKNWSAAFFKPKMGPAEKIKEILGLE